MAALSGTARNSSLTTRTKLRYVVGSFNGSVVSSDVVYPTSIGVFASFFFSDTVSFDQLVHIVQQADEVDNFLHSYLHPQKMSRLTQGRELDFCVKILDAMH